MRAAALILAALVAACRPAPHASDAPAPAAAAPEPAPAPAQAIDDLFGEWQVAAFETPLLNAQDRQVGDPGRVVFLFGSGSIDVASQCVPFFFRYRRSDRDGIEVRAVPWRGPVCARGLLPYERVFERVVGGATRIEVLPGGVRLSGAAGAVTLRRPEGGRAANPFGNQPAPGPELLWGHFRVIEAGSERPSIAHPIDIALGRMSVEARSGCVTMRWRQEWGPHGSTFSHEPWPEGVCERALTAAEQALERIMPQVRTTDWVAPYRVRLVGPVGAVVLERVGGGS